MSFVHSTIVGHFDPAKLTGRNRITTRPLDIDAATKLLAEFPEHVTENVQFTDGYAKCWWANYSMQTSGAVHKYAYRLAETQSCIAAETPVCYIVYPDSAKTMQQAAWQRWCDENPRPDPPPSTPRIFDPPNPAPCPYCGGLLRTALAKQCRHCKMDWHDPDNVHRRAV